MNLSVALVLGRREPETGPPYGFGNRSRTSSGTRNQHGDKLAERFGAPVDKCAVPPCCFAWPSERLRLDPPDATQRLPQPSKGASPTGSASPADA
jgi:hypothetical protein